MDSPSASYFEQACVWPTDFGSLPGQDQRIGETIAAIPSEVKTLLDVGCGNGFFVNRLAQTCPDRFERIVGLDRSEEALKQVDGETVCGSITALPFDDASFDLVTCLEVIEHLSQDDFQKGLRELARVSRRHVLVTVPNAQDLLGELVMCPKCYCCFNRYLHVRSFDPSTLGTLFSSLDLVECRGIGPMKTVSSYGPVLSAARLFHRRPVPPPEALCPQCGYHSATETGEQSAAGRPAPRSWLRSAANALARKKQINRWLLGLYQKREANTPVRTRPEDHRQ